MKKILAAIVLTVATTAVSFADEAFAYGVWFDSPKETTTANISGVALGVPVISFQNLNGAAFTLFGTASAQTSGFQCSLGCNKAQSLDGVQLALVNIAQAQHGDGAVQIGCYNHSEQNGIQFGVINNARDNASFQLGVFNINKNGWLPFMILFNVSKTMFD